MPEPLRQSASASALFGIATRIFIANVSKENPAVLPPVDDREKLSLNASLPNSLVSTDRGLEK